MAETPDARVRRLLVVDAAANYALGLPLLAAPQPVARALGLPEMAGDFYARVLGGVLTGVASALVLERSRDTPNRLVGLGTGGAVAVNGLGAAAVASWLLSPQARALPRRGRFLLWGVASSVLAIGTAEAWAERRARADDAVIRTDT